MLRNGMVRLGLALAAAIAVYAAAVVGLGPVLEAGVLRTTLVVVAAVVGIALALATTLYVVLVMRPAKPAKAPDAQALLEPDLRDRWVVISHVELLQGFAGGMILGAGLMGTIVGYAQGIESLHACFVYAIVLGYPVSWLFGRAQRRRLADLAARHPEIVAT